VIFAENCLYLASLSAATYDRLHGVVYVRSVEDVILSQADREAHTKRWTKHHLVRDEVPKPQIR
jgi:hypothetical protein